MKLPKVDSGQNKIPPPKPGKKTRSKRDSERKPGEAPAVSAANTPNQKPADREEDDEETGNPENPDTKDDKPKDVAKDESDADILARVRKRFKLCVGWEAENRKAALEDLKFKAGDQWPADVAAQRNTDRRPCLTVNKIPTFIHQITNDQRQNRPAINVSPVGDRGDPDAAKMYRGMIRAIERDSAADIAYDWAFEGAVSNGFGYFRILTEFESPESFDQVIRIRRIRNPFTVYLDPDHQEPDGADCVYAFITERITREEFKDKYPDADPMPFAELSIGDTYKEWVDAETLRIAEYFEIKHSKKRLVELENGWCGYYDELSDQVKEQIRTKRVLIEKEREAEVPEVRWFKVTAKDVLERNEWLGQWIPVIPVIGNEIDIEGKVKLSGLIRDSKDAQRIYNFGVTAEIELVALAPKAPWIVEEGQIEGHEQEWKAANTKNYPYLSYKGTSVGGKPAPPPQRQQMVGSPIGWINLKQGAAMDMMATTGVRFDPTNADNRVDDSGRAIREHGRASANGNFQYIDNLARSLKHAGRQMIDLIPKIYDGRRITTILREDDSEDRVMIDPDSDKAYKEVINPKTGKKIKILNPTMGKYACTVTIGPSYATKRIEASESMMMFAKAMPNVAALISDLIAKNQDWPEAEVIANRLAKSIPAQLLTPDQKDIPPQIQAVIQHLDAQVKALTQQLQQAMAALNDKEKDRQIAMSKIEADFNAKILAVVQKADEAVSKHTGQHIMHLSREVADLTAALEKEAKPGNHKAAE